MHRTQTDGVLVRQMHGFDVRSACTPGRARMTLLTSPVWGPDQLRRVNALCAFVEAAAEVPAPAAGLPMVTAAAPT